MAKLWMHPYIPPQGITPRSGNREEVEAVLTELSNALCLVGGCDLHLETTIEEALSNARDLIKKLSK